MMGVERTVRRWTDGLLRLAVNAMGTRFEIVLAGQPAVRLRAVGEAAIDEIVACHRRLTRFSEDSLLSHIVRTAHERPVRLDADTFALFEDACRIQLASRGAFNIAAAGGALPPALALDPAARTIRLTRSGTALDAGAIAKGHALDLAARVLRENGVECALLHGGTSSVIGMGAPPGMHGWKIALAAPGMRGAHRPEVTIELADRALSVSSTTGPVAWRDAAPCHHIRDGRNGRTITASRVVAVTGPTARGTDAWSTALAVLGERPASLGAEWCTWICTPRRPLAGEQGLGISPPSSGQHTGTL